MFIDWLPEVLRPWRSSALRSKRAAKGWRAPDPVSSTVETLEPLTLLSAAPISNIARNDFLSNPTGYLTGPSSSPATAVAQNYLLNHAADLGLTTADVTNLKITSQSVSSLSGATYIYYQQTYNGIPVQDSVANVTITSDGRVLSVGNRLVPNLANRINAATPLITPALAVVMAGSAHGLTSNINPTAVTVPENPTNAGANLFQNPALSLDEIPVRQVYVVTSLGDIRLSWNIVLRSPNPATPDWLDINIDGQSGEQISFTNWTHYNNDPAGGGSGSNLGAATNSLADLSSFASSTTVSDAGTGSYNVYPFPLKSPDDGPRSLALSPEDSFSSPFGWHDTNGLSGADFTDTRGNNVFAQEDINGDDLGGARPNGGQSLNFDFPLDLALDPSFYISAATTQLFYANNILHDVHARYGFDAASGNFQRNNYGQGGIGNDQVMADAQDGSGVNNANFGTPPDGFSGRMQMFTFNLTAIDRDGDLDNEIIIHEYGHGVSNRLTGGAANSGALNSLQSAGMGEGWSDFWALMFTQRPGDLQNAAYPTGNYVLGLPATGGGIRQYPYSYDMAINPHTYGDYNLSQEEHDAGEIWASTLWDLNWLLINKDGYDPDLYTGTGGNQKALSLVMEALKIQPANPTFLDGRDALLAADRLLYGGVDQYQIWQAFARRGMGFSADDGGNANSTVVTEAFDLPSTPKGEITFDRSTYSVGDTVQITLKDIDLAGTGSQDLQVISSAGDLETVQLTEVRNGGIFVGSIISKNSETTGFTINNGLLEVPRSSGISVSYFDQDDGTGNSQTVTDTATFFVFNDITKFDFSNPNGTPSTESFTISGPVNLWHLSTGRGTDLGHSFDDSFYFGQGESANGGGTYVPNSNGTLTSPQIDLTNYAGPILLSFNTFLDLEDNFDTATISVITSTGATVVIASNNGPQANLPDATGGFQRISLDLGAFAGQKIRLSFKMQSDATVQGEGWYVDDIAVTVPLATIEGTKYHDVNGNGVLELGEGPLPGWTFFLDHNNNGMLDNVVTTATHTAAVAIPDNGQVVSTLTVTNLTGTLTDLNVNLSIDHTRNSDLSVTLVSPKGTRVLLFNNVGGMTQNFTNTTLNDQANLSINSGSGPFTGSYSPQGLLSILNGEDPNGVWKLEVRDNLVGQTGKLQSWSIAATTTLGSSVTDASTTAIPDAGQVFSTLTVNSVVGPITDLNVNLSISHTRNSDLDVFLVSPNGTRVELFTDVGGQSQNFVNTTLDDQANFTINLASSPFIGSFSPEGFLSALNGENPNGVWTLEVYDDTAGSTGTLLNWSITVTTAEGSAVTDANGHYVLAVPVGGTFNVREVPQAGWVQSFPAPTAGNPFPAQQVTVPFGGIVQDVDFYNQFILPIITLPNGPTIYTENEPPVSIDIGARVTDANSASFANGTVTVTLINNATLDDRLSIRSVGFGAGQIGMSGNQVYYQANLLGTFAGGVGANPLVVTLSANATPAAVQALLRVVQFEAVGDDPSPLTRTVQIIVTDGIDGASTPATKQIIVIPVNDAPVVTLSNSTLDYPENGEAQPVDIFANVTDPDSSDFGGGYLRVRVSGNEGGATQTTQRTFVSNNAPVPLNYNLNPTNPTIQSPLIVSGADGTLSDVNVTVNITHTNNPELTAYLISPNGTRVKLFSNVGTSLFPGSSRNFTNTTFDDQASTQILSQFATAPFTGSFQPEKELSPLNGQNPNGTWNLELTDALGTLIADGTGSLVTWSLTLTMTEVSVNEKLAILNQGQGPGTIGLVGNRVTYGGTVIGNYSGGVGTSPLLVAFNANATQAAVRSLMQNVTLEVLGDTPILGLRQVEFIVNDGDGSSSLPLERLVNVVAVNDPPVLTLPSGQSLYMESGLPIVLDTFAILTDIDSADFEGGVLTVDLGTTAKATDRLGIRSASQAVGAVNIFGATVRYGTTAIGTMAGGTNGIPLTVNFNSSATPAAVQAVVRAITFQAAGSNPNTAVRIATFQVTDGDGGASALISKVITVQQINDPPVLNLTTTTNPPDTAPVSQVRYNANGLPIVLDPQATVTDPDTLVFNGGRLTVTLTSGSAVSDRLSLISQGNVGVAGSNVTFGGIVVGRLSPGVGSAPLTVDFNASASKDAVQAVVRSVTFQNVGLDPAANDRIAAFQITDGAGGVSATKTRRIIFQVAGQAPVNTVPAASIAADLVLYDFSSADNSAESQGFTSSGTSNLWHLTTTGRDTESGHSSGGSFYFGTGETDSSQGLYVGNARGTLTSPQIDLTTGSNFDGPVQLTFKTFMNFEDVNDTATVSVITSSGTTIIASNNGVLSNLPDATGGFQQISLDLSAFVGQAIRVSFSVQTNGLIQREGWYVDDIAVTVPFEFQTSENSSVAITGLSISDADAGQLPMQVTLSALHGTISIDTAVVGGLGSSEVTGNGTNRVVLSGDQISINATLQSLNGVVYQGNTDYNGSDQLTMLTSDLGNTGPSGVLTDSDSVFLNIQAVLDAATITPSASIATNTKGREAILDSSIKAKLGDNQTNLKDAVLLVNVGANRNRSDRLRVSSDGKGAGQINTSSTSKKGILNLRLGTLVIGTVSGGENGKPLKVVFNANAAAADLQHVLRLITFRTAVETTVYGLRTITYNFTDALLNPSNQVTKQVNVVRP